MAKRGQVSYFLIVGIIIVIIVFFFQFLNANKSLESKPIEQLNFESNANIFENYVNSCIKEIVDSAFFLIGVHGGYIDLEEPYFFSGYYYSKYIYYYNKTYLPSIENIQDQVSRFVEQNVYECIDDNTFPDLHIDYQIPSAQTIIDDTTTKVMVNWIVTISQNNSLKHIENFEYISPVRFKVVYDTVSYILNDTIKHPEIIDAFSLLTRNETFIEFIVFNDTDVIYLVADNKSIIKGKPYYFIFATRNLYNFTKNRKPVLKPMPNMTATIGERFIFQVEAREPDNDTIQFSAITPLFEIDKNSGLIDFIPTNLMKGVHYIYIEVKDSRGKQDNQVVRFEVR